MVGGGSTSMSNDKNKGLNPNEKPHLRKHWELWYHTEQEFQSMKIALTLLSGVAVLSIFFTFYILQSYDAAIKERPVIAVPGIAQPMIYKPGKLPDEVVGDLARRFVLTIHLYSAANGASNESISAALGKALNYMTPRARDYFGPKFDKKIKNVIDNKESSIFIPFEEKTTITKTERGGRRVSIYGNLTKFIGAIEQSKTLVRADVDFIQVPATETNPYGLLIDRYSINKVTD